MIQRYQTLARPHKWLIVIILVAVLVRIAAAIYMGNAIRELPGISDQVSYHNLALRVLDGAGFSFDRPWWPATAANEPTAHWSYLYTLYLTIVYFIFGRIPLIARIIQAIVVGTLMPWLVYRMSTQIFPDENRAGRLAGRFGITTGQLIGLTAAAIISVYVYFIYYAAALITESFYITTILWSFTAAINITHTAQPTRRQWILWGLSIGTAVLLRQIFLLFLPFFFVWLWWSCRPKITNFLIPVGILALMILPFTVRNGLAFDRFVLLNTNAGYAFYWGNHPIYGTRFIPILPGDKGSYFRLIPQELLAQGLNEAELDSALLGRALGFIQEDPQRYLLLSLSRFAPYFQFWPSAQSSLISNISRLASFGLFLPFMLYGLIQTIRSQAGSLKKFLASPLLLILLFIVVYTGIHVLTWTLIRYRLPIDALLVIFAGMALADLGERLVWRWQPRTRIV